MRFLVGLVSTGIDDWTSTVLFEPDESSEIVLEKSRSCFTVVIRIAEGSASCGIPSRLFVEDRPDWSVAAPALGEPVFGVLGVFFPFFGVTVNAWSRSVP